MRPRDEHLQRRGRALIELVARRLPQEFDVPGDDAWPAVGVALLSRMTTTLDSILRLQHTELEADAATLVRGLYEHAVHLAWLAAGPPVRITAWREHDELMRVRADIDARERGIRLSDTDFDELKARRTALRGKELHTLSLTGEADAHWAERVGLGQNGAPTTFRDMYVLLFRNYSAVLHPTARGLNRVYDELSPTRRRIRLEKRYEGSGPYGIATVVFGAALFVAAHSIGWPTTDEVEDIFAREPDATEELPATKAPPPSVELVWEIARERSEAQSLRLARLDSKSTPLLAFGVALATFFQASRAHVGNDAALWGTALGAVGLLSTLGVMFPREFKFAPELKAFIRDAAWEPKSLKERYLGNLRGAAAFNDRVFDRKVIWFKVAVWIYALAILLGVIASIGPMVEKDRPAPPTPATSTAEPSPYEPPPDRADGTGVEKHGAGKGTKIVVRYDGKNDA